MTVTDLTYVASDNAVTRRERRRQSAYREQVLALPPGTARNGSPLGNYLPAEDRRSNFLSDEAADYAAARVEIVRREGGQLEQTRLFTNMLSSMPLCFSVFGHLRAHPDAAVRLLSTMKGQEVDGFERVTVGGRSIDGIECEWAPERREHLEDGTAFDAVIAARLRDGRRLLIAVETKYVDTFSRDKPDADKDRKYRNFCEQFGMGPTAFDALSGPATRQLLRNVLLTESVRRGGASAMDSLFDDALTLVLARDDDAAARSAVAAVERERGAMPTDVAFVGHGELARVASAVDGLDQWAARFHRRYIPPLATS
ncbi:PGN_0703 family putative restriction endonuclease [Blastococcus sp. SYSU DS0669]